MTKVSDVKLHQVLPLRSSLMGGKNVKDSEVSSRIPPSLGVCVVAHIWFTAAATRLKTDPDV